MSRTRPRARRRRPDRREERLRAAAGRDGGALAIIRLLNETFGTDFTEDDRVFIRQLEEKLTDDAALEASVRVNPPENARLTFDHVVGDRIDEMIDTNFKFYKRINGDREFAKFLIDWLFDRYRRRALARGEIDAEGG